MDPSAAVGSRDYALKAPLLAQDIETQAYALTAYDLVHLPGPLTFWATSKGHQGRAGVDDVPKG